MTRKAAIAAFLWAALGVTMAYNMNASVIPPKMTWHEICTIKARGGLNVCSTEQPPDDTSLWALRACVAYWQERRLRFCLAGRDGTESTYIHNVEW